jgi:hypothetical protein
MPVRSAFRAFMVRKFVLERISIGRKDDTALVVGLSDRKGVRKTNTIRRTGAIDQILMTNGRKPSFGGFGLTFCPADGCHRFQPV